MKKKIDELKNKIEFEKMKGSNVITNDLKKLANKFKIEKRNNNSDSEESEEEDNDKQLIPI